MRQVGRICYGIAAALGLLSLGVEWQDRQKRGQARRLFPHPPSHTGMLLALWAGMVALMGKVMEDAGQRQPMSVGMTGAQGRSMGIGPYTAYVPKLFHKQTQTLHSDFDLGDHYVDSRSNARPLAATH
jgi:hypothetical protein